MEAVKNLFIGASGIGAIEVVQSIPSPSSGDIKDVVSIVVQILIGVATLIGIFRKKKA